MMRSRLILPTSFPDKRKEKIMMKPAKDSLDLGILVSDIKASLNFYQNLLGLAFVGETPLWFGTMYRLQFGSSDFKLIELRDVVDNIEQPKTS